MKIYLNNPNIEYIECSVDEFEKIKEFLNNSNTHIHYIYPMEKNVPIEPYYKYNTVEPYYKYNTTIC